MLVQVQVQVLLKSTETGNHKPTTGKMGSTGANR
jgi:hypothetical protein